MNEDKNYNSDDAQSSNDYMEENDSSVMDSISTTSGRGRKITITVITVLIIAAGLYLINQSFDSSPVSESDSSSEEEVTTPNSDSTATISDLPHSLTVNNQPAGDSIEVVSVSTPSDSWLSVEEGEGGVLLRTLGALWLPAGSHTNQTINLLRGTESGNTYYVTIRLDNGNRDFERSLDLPLIDEDGIDFSVSFTAE